jgi:hypothetical protein
MNLPLFGGSDPMGNVLCWHDRAYSANHGNSRFAQ